MMFDAANAGCWYSKAKFYEENRLSKKSIQQFLEKSIQLDPTLLNHAAKRELQKLN